jgi:chorismate-pyruvate lyase
MTLTPSRQATPELNALVHLFYSSLSELGQFTEVAESEMPEVPRKLLWHDAHMTVTVESHHQSPVNVRVLDTHVTPSHYSRRILLQRQSDGRVVQFGIVRLNSTFLGEDVRQEIESEATPLGRVLIEHNVLRDVRLLSLWKIEPSDDLVEAFGLENAETCYGRTALIYCNGLPAVELLEIVTPVE